MKVKIKRLSAEFSHYLSNVAILEEADSGDAASAGIKTRLRILKVDPAQRQDWKPKPAGGAKSFDPGGMAARHFALLKNRGEDGEISARRCSPGNLVHRMARHSDLGFCRRVCALKGLPGACPPHCAHVRWRDIRRPQMDAIRAGGHGNISA